MLGRLPFRAAMAVGTAMGALAYLLIGGPLARRIETAFPGRGRRIARAHLAHVGMAICEFLRVGRCPQDLSRVDVRGWEHLPPEGGVLLGAHFGNFELMGWVLGQSGHKIADLAWRPDDPLIRFVDLHRRASGIHFIYTTDSATARVRAFLQAERMVTEGYVVGFMVDAAVSGGLEVEFLGRRSRFDMGGELLAGRTRKPIAAGFITRTEGGHLMEILPLPTYESLRTFVEMFEERARARPEQYFWPD